MAFLEIQDQLTRGVIQDELIKIVAATHQTIFMITHDVDEAILLAGRILLMSNGRVLSVNLCSVACLLLPRSAPRG